MNPTNHNKKIEGHNYDGIEELDNPPPDWFRGLFYGTIVIAAVYFFYYATGEGQSIHEEYLASKKQDETISILSAMGTQNKVDESELKLLTKSSDQIKIGRALFESKCVSCHGSLGQGGIGPNLTDPYWLHGAKMTEIFNTISNGVADKGMPPWGGVLKTEETKALTVYVRSIVGTTPPTPKAPQGVIVKYE